MVKINMKMMHRHFFILFILFLFSKHSFAQKASALIDANATKETEALRQNLKNYLRNIFCLDISTQQSMAMDGMVMKTGVM
jgi:hypothetical protein